MKHRLPLKHQTSECNDIDDDHVKDECGVFGVWGDPQAANLTYLGLYSLQHRGQEGAGIATMHNGTLLAYRKKGLVSKIFGQKEIDRLPGNSAIGHVRYGTAGERAAKNVQPLVVNCDAGQLAIAHNGNLTNALEIRERLEKSGSIFQTTSDTEVILHLIAKSRKKKLTERIIDALSQVEGAYSVLILTEEGLYAARDPYGYRPLVLGRYNNSHIICSETCAMYIIGGEYDREVEPGELIHVDNNGFLQSRHIPNEVTEKRQCVFEYVYLARPDSTIFGRNVYHTRKAFGRQLAKEVNKEADIVIPVPDSGVPAAIGYAEESKLPFELGIMRNNYVGRTFIEPHQEIRDFGVKLKLNPIADVLRGKRVIVVDDSLVRGTTSKKIIQLMRNAGAKEVHFALSSPQIINPCTFGVDTPNRKELMANNYSLEQMRQFIGADSLSFLSVEGLFAAADLPKSDFCWHCFNADHEQT